MGRYVSIARDKDARVFYCMSYIVIKTINGRQYRYEQTSYRVGKKVRTKSRYLGPVGGTPRRGLLATIGDFIEAQRVHGPVFDEEAMLRDVIAKDKAHAEMIARLEKELGVKLGVSNPVPIEKPVPTVSSVMASAVSPSAPPASASAAPSPDAPGQPGEQSAADDAGTDASP